MSQKMYLTVLDKKAVEKYRTLAPSSEMPNNPKERADRFLRFGDFPKMVMENFGKRDEHCVGFLPVREDIGEPFFDSPGLQNIVESNKPRIINQEEYLEIIESMRTYVVKYYENLLLRDTVNEWQRVLNDILNDWKAPKGVLPYDVDIETKNITTTFRADYQIFDMIRMFKSINWKRQVVLFWVW